jgi:hypothetical protein
LEAVALLGLSPTRSHITYGDPRKSMGIDVMGKMLCDLRRRA